MGRWELKQFLDLNDVTGKVLDRHMRPTLWPGEQLKPDKRQESSHAPVWAYDAEQRAAILNSTPSGDVAE